MGHVLGITAPIYLLIAAGYAAVRLGWMAAPDLGALGRFVARFCVPALLFRAVSRQPVDAVLHGDYLAVYAIGSLLVFGAVVAFARLGLARPLSLAAMLGLGAAGSNSAFVGYPIAEQVLGPATAGLALAMGMLVENLLVMPLALALADSDATAAGGPVAGRWRAALAAAARGALRNPMIGAILAGVAVAATGVPLPAVIDRTVALVAAAAAPTALFVIGGSLVGLQLSGIRPDLLLAAGGKLLLHPLAVLAALLVVPVGDPALRAAALLFAAMPMFSIYPVLAQRYGHERLCAAALLAATVASFASVALLIAALPAATAGLAP